REGASFTFPGDHSLREGVLRLTPAGANPGSRIEGIEPLEGKVHYLAGNDPARWITDVPTFAAVRYAAIRPGMDLVFRGDRRRIEVELRLGPGVDAAPIDFIWSG